MHEVGPRVMGGQIVYPFSEARSVLSFFRDFMPEARDELQCFPFVYTVPPIEPFPKQLHGRSVLALVSAWTGQESEGENALAQLRRFGSPALDAIMPLEYVELQQSFDSGMPKGLRWISRGHYLDSLSDAAIDTMLAHTETIPGAYTTVYFEPYGGAVARVEPAATAFPHRRAAYGFQFWQDGLIRLMTT